MDASKNAKVLVTKISDHSESNLKNLFEVTTLLEISKAEEMNGRFRQLIFSAKYVNGLKSVLGNRAINKDQYMEKIFGEFNTNIQKVVSILDEMTVQSKENVRKFFNDKYFLMNHESIANTMELIEDLSLCKEYFNENPDELNV
ncbi:MAG: hypothetical protein SGI89_05255 [bacterium]|nr:hypothetical protein [bacterium]